MDSIKRAAKIKEALYVKGLTFADIDRAFGLPEGTARTTVREPNAKGEAALAEALAFDPQKMWAERYYPSGLRKEPQPRENYERPPTMRQRRNAQAA